MTDHPNRRQEDSEYKDLVKLVSDFVTNFDERIKIHMEPFRIMVDKHEKDLEGNGKPGMKADQAATSKTLGELCQEVHFYRWVFAFLVVAVAGAWVTEIFKK